MPSDSGERRPTKTHQVGAPPPEPEHLPCPRCNSTNTKFCYYNNYNFSQPRHFCKSCRRYWTHGGTLRDIPVGGGTRKNAKRSRTSASATSSSSASQDHHHRGVPNANPFLVPLSAAGHGGSVPFGGDAKSGINVCGSFTTLLSTQAPGYLALGGFGLGFEDVANIGLGRSVWPFPGVGDGGAGSSMNDNAWQLESGESGYISGDCFPLPELAISTPGSGLK